MKMLLRISVCLNLALTAGLVLVLLKGPKRVAPPAPPAVVNTSPGPMVMAQTPTPAASPAGPAPFRWRQLEARDYHVFVKNLRDIGCPEATVRAIVTADVYAVYENRIRALEKRIAELNAGSWTNWLAGAGTETELKSELEQIPDGEAAEINELLGVKGAPAQDSVAVASATASANASAKAAARSQPASMPLALQNVDLTAMNLNDVQKQVIENIRQNFLDQIGGTNQDPNDPAYLARWQQAQPEADNRLRGMLGTAFFQDYQLTANNPMANAGNEPDPAANR